MSAVDWQTAKARAYEAMRGCLYREFNDDELTELLAQGIKALRDSGYLIVRASDPPQHVRSLGFQAHANGGPKAFGVAYEAMVREMAKETVE